MRVPQFWRLMQHNYRLMGRACPQCGATRPAGRPVCEICAWPQNQDGAILVLFDPASVARRDGELVTIARDEPDRAQCLRVSGRG